MSSDPAAMVVTGDLTVDWVIATPPNLETNLELAYLWDRPDTVSITSRPGGSALIASLLESSGCSPTLVPPVPDSALRDPRQQEVARTFSAWAYHQREHGSGENCWRMREFLGQVPAAPSADDTPIPPGHVLVVADSNLGFRESATDWATRLPNLGAASSVVVRMSPPLAGGPLWEHISAHARDRLTLICALDDLRREDAAIGGALSWERTASEIVAAVRARDDLRGLGRVIITVGLAGSVVVEPERAFLVYDPLQQEGDWESRRPGLIFGAGAAVTAAVGAGLGRGTTVLDAIAAGLAWARASHEAGVDPASTSGAAFPNGPSGNVGFSQIEVPGSQGWTILSQRSGGHLEAFAMDALLAGIGAICDGVPLERMRAWTSIDRGEIESVRSVRNIVREYLGQNGAAKPLSIAVFGPPGSGKSFAVKQLASEAAEGPRPLRTLEFNLSQFDGPHALAGAFQLVRDCAVQGVLPVVFWDEFDSAPGGSELGWLASFLAPMQDGVFLERATPQPIGPAVFVFAGGTHATMEGFKTRATDIPGAKATDFISRLRGFIDVFGPNQDGPADSSYVVRRALVLRQALLRRAPQLFQGERLNIDEGVAHAFLRAERFYHGARSMEAVVEMSSLAGKRRFGRSSLPAAPQLDLHVDARGFMELVGG